MTTRAVLRSAAACALAAACGSASAIAAPVLRSADVRIAVTSPTSCEVTMRLAVDGAAEVDHRIESFEGSRVEVVDVLGARRAGAQQSIGRTQSLVLIPDGPYVLHYRALQPESRANRCPLWLPTVPTAGRPGTVSLIVDLPPSTTAGGSMPAFAWEGSRGSATLAHLPSIVIVGYGPEGRPRNWEVARIVDLLAMTIFAGASAIWVWRARR